VSKDEEQQTRIFREQRNLAPAESGEDCLVVISSPAPTDLGRRHLIDRPLTIGRGLENDITLQSDTVSRRHAQVERQGKEIVVTDLRSTNGIFVNDDLSRITRAPLKRGDLLRVGDTVFKYLSGSDVEAQYHLVISRMAMTDGLTNLCNRKQLDALLEEEVRRAQRYSRELSLMMIDIDHFKRINDSYGHPVGDSVLIRVAALLGDRLRPSDKLGRYGGEEFCAILPETTLSSAVQIAEALRVVIAEQRIVVDQQPIAVSVSIGAAEWSPQMGAMELYRAADQMLYRAKGEGRNRVCS
jgi:two-component system, cell cycle response regulator